MAALLSQRKYAAHRGVTLRAVQKAIASGRITLVVDPETRKPKIDAAIADAQWARNTDVDQQMRGNGGLLPAGPAGGAAALLGGSGESGERGDQAGDDDRDELLKHKTASAKADAQMKTMQALERADELVPADDIDQELRELARTLRNSLLAIPDRVAQVLDPTSPERARKLLDGEIKKALRDVTERLEERAAAAAGGEKTLQ